MPQPRQSRTPPRQAKGPRRRFAHRAPLRRQARRMQLRRQTQHRMIHRQPTQIRRRRRVPSSRMTARIMSFRVLRSRPHAINNPQWRSLAALQRWMRRPRAGPFPRPLDVTRATSELARVTSGCPSESRLTSTRPQRRPPPKAAARSLRTRLTELRQARQPACRHPPQRPPGSLWTLPGRLTCGDKPARLPPRPGTRPQRGRTTSGTRHENIGSAAEWNNISWDARVPRSPCRRT